MNIKTIVVNPADYDDVRAYGDALMKAFESEEDNGYTRIWRNNSFDGNKGLGVCFSASLEKGKVTEVDAAVYNNEGGMLLIVPKPNKFGAFDMEITQLPFNIDQDIGHYLIAVYAALQKLVELIFKKELERDPKKITPVFEQWLIDSGTKDKL